MKISNKVSGFLLIPSFVLTLLGPITVLAAGPAAINLGFAGNFVVLAKTGISTTGSTSIVGDLGVSPAAASYITGFALTLPAASAFSTSALVTGKIYAPGYADPTPANLTTAVLDMQTAYTDGASRASGVTELGAGNIGGLTLVPNVYKWSTSVTIPTDVTLSGSADDVWIFQIAQNLTVSSGARIILAGGAQAKNIFWVVAGQTTLGTTSVLNGNILGQTSIVLNTGAQLNGRLLAQAAVTLDGNAVAVPTSVSPTPVVPPPAPTPTPTPTPASSSTPTPTPSPTPMFTPAPNPVLAALETNVILLTQRDALRATLQVLQAQAAQQASASGNASTIVVDLRSGSRGDDVTTLQRFLISQNKGSAAQALSQVGATAYFGALTRAALAEFQANVGINPALGNFGPITRAYVSAHY